MAYAISEDVPDSSEMSPNLVEQVYPNGVLHGRRYLTRHFINPHFITRFLVQCRAPRVAHVYTDGVRPYARGDHIVNPPCPISDQIGDWKANYGHVLRQFSFYSKRTNKDACPNGHNRIGASRNGSSYQYWPYSTRSAFLIVNRALHALTLIMITMTDTVQLNGKFR